jgi:hypothetical protein
MQVSKPHKPYPPLAMEAVDILGAQFERRDARLG